MMAKKPKPSASLVPHECVILAIDPGKTSGTAVLIDGKWYASGTAKHQIDRVVACETAAREARCASLPLVIVAEKWTPGGKFAGARTMAGLGTSWGLWLAAIEDAGIPKSRIVRVHTQTWRGPLLGGGRGVTSDEFKMRARVRASRTAGRPIADDNEADAICIGLWSARASEVAAVLPKPRMKKGARAT